MFRTKESIHVAMHNAQYEIRSLIVCRDLLLFLFQKHDRLDSGVSRIEVEDMLDDTLDVDVNVFQEYLDLVFNVKEYISADDVRSFTEDAIALLLR